MSVHNPGPRSGNGKAVNCCERRGGRAEGLSLGRGKSPLQRHVSAVRLREMYMSQQMCPEQRWLLLKGLKGSVQPLWARALLEEEQPCVSPVCGEGCCHRSGISDFPCLSPFFPCSAGKDKTQPLLQVTGFPF